jgi:hypothetical protein
VPKRALTPILQRLPALQDQNGPSTWVENFVTNPNLSNARSKTGINGLSASEIQLVQDKGICQHLNGESDGFTDEYVITYYRTDNFYFVTQILKRPGNANEITSGLMMVYVLDSNLNFIKGYSG